MNRTAIIIPTYNHLEDCLKPCLQSIMRFTNLDDKEGHRVIVIANGCSDNTGPYLRGIASIYPWLYFEIVDEQLGYTKAANLGLKKAMEFEDFDRFVLLNNDTVLLDQNRDAWLEILNSGFANEKTAVTGTVMKRDEVVSSIEFLIFFCVMLSRKAVETIGLLDEEFSPGFGEDMDYCERARKAGFEICRVPIGEQPRIEGGMYLCSFPLYHAGTKTFINEPKYQEVIARNRRRLVEKHCTPDPNASQTPK